jgi:hypothetical protein
LKTSVIVDAFDDTWNALAQPKQTSNKAVQLTAIWQSQSFTQNMYVVFGIIFLPTFARIHFDELCTDDLRDRIDKFIG